MSSHCAEARASYEIRVTGDIPASLLERYPALEVHLTGAETVLHRDVDDLADLDRLLAQLQSLGLVLSELRASAVGQGQRRSYEVHVESVPGRAVLRSIPWSHLIQAGQSVVRVRGSAAGIARLVGVFAASGLTVERITRLDPESGRRGRAPDSTDQLPGWSSSASASGHPA